MNCTTHVFDVHLQQGKWRVDISNTDGAGVYSGPGAHGRIKFMGKTLVEAFELPPAVILLLEDHGYVVG